MLVPLTRYLLLIIESGTPIFLDTIVDRYVSTDTMIDNRTGPCKARYTYTVIQRYNRTVVQAKPCMHIVIHRYNRTGIHEKPVIHRYSRTGVHAKPDLHIHLFTDTIELV